MSREFQVYIDLQGETVVCGRLWTRALPREGASFEYDAFWLARRGAFALEPELPLARGLGASVALSTQVHPSFRVQPPSFPRELRALMLLM